MICLQQNKINGVQLSVRLFSLEVLVVLLICEMRKCDGSCSLLSMKEIIQKLFCFIDLISLDSGQGTLLSMH